MIILFDIKSQNSTKGLPSPSPNTLKVRMSLNYKRLPFAIEYIEYYEIQDTVKSLGGVPPPSENGMPRYTVPTILDTDTCTVVTDSTAIAEYLDRTYPNSPSGPLFPNGSRAAIDLFEQTYTSEYRHLNIIMVPSLNKVMTPTSQKYHRGVIEAHLKKKLEELPCRGSRKYEESMQEAQEGLSRFAKLYKRNGEGSLWFFGDTFSFADIIAASFLTTFKLLMGEESEEWQRVASWDEGRWARLVNATKVLTGCTE